MTRAIIDPERCTLCPDCLPLRICPAKAISRLDPDYPPSVEERFCTVCGDCVNACSPGAIVIQ